MGPAQQQAPRPAPGTLIGERYELDQVIGRGGMATVWRARDRVLERPVAVKLLSADLAEDPQYLARFEREAKLAASLSHPNLVRVYDFGAGPERPYLVMEFIGGGDLAARLAGDRPVPAEALAAPLLRAVAHIHDAGVIHRDIKPGNVLFEETGRPRLTDFGIAQREDALTLTKTGDVLGTLRYIAPERLEGEPADERTDLFSCGVVLRECLDGSEAASFGELVERLAAKDPGERPASALEALEELGEVSDPHARIGPGAPVPVAGAPSAVPTQPIDAGTDEDAATGADTAELPAAPAAMPPRSPSTFVDPRDQTHDRSGGPPRLWVVGALFAVLAAVAAIAALSGRDDPASPAPATQAETTEARPTTTNADEEQPAEESPPPAPTEEEPPPPEDVPTVDEAIALNTEGFAILENGDPEAAIPYFEEAITAWPEGSTDLEYAYTLFNLGRAYREAGRFEEAIPILEQRLQIPDQTETVQTELDLARAGISEPADEVSEGTERSDDPGPGNSDPNGNAFGHDD